jgi:hypothetical protein
MFLFRASDHPLRSDMAVLHDPERFTYLSWTTILLMINPFLPFPVYYL